MMEDEGLPVALKMFLKAIINNTEKQITDIQSAPQHKYKVSANGNKTHLGSKF